MTSGWVVRDTTQYCPHNQGTIKGSQVWALGISGYMCTYMYMYKYMVIMIMTFCDGSLEIELR